MAAGDLSARPRNRTRRRPGGGRNDQAHGAAVCALLAARDHVNVFVYDGGIVPDPHGLITAGHDNQTARTIGFREGQAMDEEALLAFFQRIIANNRAGGWRRLSADGRR